MNKNKVSLFLRKPFGFFISKIVGYLLHVSNIVSIWTILNKKIIHNKSNKQYETDRSFSIYRSKVSDMIFGQNPDTDGDLYLERREIFNNKKSIE